MKNILIWILFAVLSLSVLVGVFLSPVLNYGGDIAEYHGITETIIKSGTIALTPVAEFNLRRYLPSSYFDNAGYYIRGTDGRRYPVHFIFYSLLAVPVRLVLHMLSINELQSLRITNVIIFIAVLLFSLKYLTTTPLKRFSLITAVFLSPLLFFLSWPGPDIYYLVLLFISIQLFLKKRYISSGILIALAAMQSQPLGILAGLVGVFALIDHFKNTVITKEYIRTHMDFALKLGIIGIILLIPVYYNYLFFGTWSPWVHLQDGWTLIRGFGLQNISLQKLYEQFFDLNFGLFFYAPVLIMTGFYYLIKNIKNKSVIFLFVSFIITAFFYQTNPAWHYGTAGYGPSRHAIFLLPLFLVLFIENSKATLKFYILLVLLLVTQIPILYMNGFVAPTLPNTLQQTPMAQFVLNRWPSLYNPTPEIFVDRTNHTDIDHPTSAIYTYKGMCKKAYILKTDMNLLQKTCGYIPKGYENALNDDLSLKSNIYRSTMTIDATFWPDPKSCSKDYKGPYFCMITSSDFSKGTGVTLPNSRVVNTGQGVWRIVTGKPLTITVPPGYFIQYSSFDGTYINY